MKERSRRRKALAVSLAAVVTLTSVPFTTVKAAEAADNEVTDEIADKYKGEDYRLVWNDEFDGEGLNLEDWNVEEHEPGWVNAELQRYTKLDEGNIKVADGKLVIQPKATPKAGSNSEGSRELLKNAGFESADGTNAEGWLLSVTSPGEGSVAYQDGKAIITVDNPGEENWNVQLQQQGIRLVQGHKYEFQVTAKADTARKVEVNALDPNNEYAWYGGGTLDISTQEKPFSFQVDLSDNQKVTSSTIALQINFGLIGESAKNSAATTVTLSNISFRDITEGLDEEEEEKEYEITSGRITTQGKQDFTYGRFEARAKVPTGMGYLPAFWLMATNEHFYGQWPRCGEIDIMEVMGQETNKSYHTIHYGYDASSGHKENQGTKVLKEGSYADEYHVFRVDWEPGSITWYVDDQQVYTTSSWYTGQDDSSRLTYPAPFDQNFYIILNLAVGGSWVGYPDQSVYEDMENQAYYVDYVRVYQKSAEAYADAESTVEDPPVTYREADESGNYVRNGDFAQDISLDGAGDADADNWKLHLENDAKGTTYTVSEKAIRIQPAAEGSMNHSVQLKQENVPMYKGWEYELSFDASADEERTIIVDVEGPERNWIRYMADTTFNLTTEKKTYTHSFTMDEKTDANGSLEFNLGNQGSLAGVTISNVRLTHKSGEELPEDTTKEIRADGNYIYNGSFDQGDRRLGYWEYDREDAAQISVTNTNNIRQLKVKVEVPDGADEAHPVTISQSELAPLAAGRYELSFDAYMEEGGEADALTVTAVGHDFTPELTTKSVNYAEKITLEENLEREDANVTFAFTKPGTYYLDNVRLVENAMIKNGSFDAGLVGFAPYVHSNISASYVVDNMNGNDNAFAITIEDTVAEDAANSWYVQLNQDGVNLEKGKNYRISFRAKSSIARKISYALQQYEGDWTNYSGTGAVNLTSEWQTFTNEFTMTSESDPATRFNITMGSVDGERITQKHVVYIDDIVLEEIESESDETKQDDTEVRDEDDQEEVKEPENPVSEPENPAKEQENPVKEPEKSTEKQQPSTPEVTPGDLTGKQETASGTNNNGKAEKGETVVTKEGTYTATGAKTATFTLADSKATTVTIPSTVKIDGVQVKVTEIAAKAFRKNMAIKSVTIGKNIKTIGANAFEGAGNLKTVKMAGTSLTTIKKNAFKGDTKLKTLDLSKQKNLKKIEANAFAGCKKLKTIKLNGNKLTSVAKSAFKSCPNKKSTKVTIYAKDKKQFGKVVKKLKKAGLSKATYIFKKK